jgi:putative ABC transport system permease protein
MNMYKIYLKQAWALLKENKLLSGVSIFGTALAICMIMVIVIVPPITHRKTIETG